MKKKKIAFVTPMYLPAPLYGSDNAVRTLAEEFAKRGHEVAIITSNAYTPRYWYDPFLGKKVSHGETRIQGVTVRRLQPKQLFSSIIFILSKIGGAVLPTCWIDRLQIISNGPYLMGLEEELVKGKFDVIHCSPFPLAINQQVVDAFSHMDKKPRIILTPFFHSEVSAYHNQYLGVLMRNADIIHAITYSEKKDIEQQFAESRGKVSVVPLFLRVEGLDKQKTTHVSDFRKKYHLENRIVILFAGLKGRMKGALDVLAVTQELYRADPRFLLVAIGHNTDEWNGAIRDIDPRSLLDLPYVDEYAKGRIFTACNMVCMPSKSESFGFVYLEAWYKKKPVIAADIPAMREIVGVSHGGLLVPFGNKEKLRAAIEELARNTVLSKRLGEQGYAVLQKKYLVSSVIADYEVMFL